MKQLTIPNILGVALLGSLVLICSNGLSYSGITVFDEALINEFGWSKSELKFRDLLNLICLGLLGPVVGIVIDKYGAKRTIIGGLIILAVLYYLYAFVQASWHMYLIHIGLAFAVAGSGGLAVVIMVSTRIKERRGTAMGIALAGTSLGGIVMPQIGTRLLEHYDWRASFQYEAIIPIIIACVIFFFLRPGQKGSSPTAEKEELSGIEFRKAIKTPVFWAICFCGIFCFYAILAIISNLFLYLRELDFTPTQASNAFSIFFGVILIAKLASGVVTEYINEYYLFRIQLILMLLGAVGIALNAEAFVWPSLIAVGLGWGGLYTIFNYIIITVFGLKSAGKIGGVITSFEGLGSGLGAWVTGLISDRTGSYSMSFWLVVALLTIALGIAFFIKPLDKPQGSTVTSD